MKKTKTKAMIGMLGLGAIGDGTQNFKDTGGQTGDDARKKTKAGGMGDTRDKKQ